MTVGGLPNWTHLSSKTREQRRTGEVNGAESATADQSAVGLLVSGHCLDALHDSFMGVAGR